MSIPQDHRSPHRNQRWIELENVDSVALPARCALEIVDVYNPESGSEETPGYGREVWKVRISTTDDPCNWCVNGECEVPVGGTGKPGTKDSPFIGLVETSVASGDQLGIESGNPAFVKDRCGVIVDGHYDAATSTAQMSRFDQCEEFDAVRAYECSYPGVAALAIPQKYVAGVGYQDAQASPVSIEDPMCWRFALPDEIYPVKSTGRCGSRQYRVASQYGLHRVVKVSDCIAPGMSGTGRVQQPNCLAGSGGGCAAGDTDCLITVCNLSGRPIAPCGYEYADATLVSAAKSGSGGSTLGCCWHLTPWPYPTSADAKLVAKLCRSDQTNAAISDVVFNDYTGTWAVPTEATNPMGLEGCIGADVTIQPRFYIQEDGSCGCEWEIVMVKPKLVPAVISDIQWACEDTSCKLDVKRMINVLVWSCDDTVCGTLTWENLVTGSIVTSPSGIETVPAGSGGDCEGGQVVMKQRKFCAFCVATAADVPLFNISYEQVVTSFTGPTGGSGTGQCDVTANRTAIMSLSPVGEVCTPPDDDTVTVISGESQLVTVEIVGVDGCPQQTQVEICVLWAGDEDGPNPITGIECTDCSTGSGS